MKTRSFAIALLCLLTACISDNSKTEQPSPTRQVISYQCQQNKHVDIEYLFDAKGFPTQANVVIKGKTISMVKNNQFSDAAGFFFGKEKAYNMGTNVFNAQNVKKSSILLISPSNRILYKNCDAQ